MKKDQDFERLVSLIKAQEGVPDGKARFMAWLEGPEGLTRRGAAA